MTAKLDGTNGLIQQYDYQASTTGFSYTFAAGTTVLVMNPAGTLATGTITMPASPADGMTITFSSTQTITALTVNANTGQSIVSAPTTLLAGQAATYVYRLTGTSWYPIQTVPSANTQVGIGQTWQNVLVTPGRVSGTTYTNSTSKPIQVFIGIVNGNSCSLTLAISGVTSGFVANNNTNNTSGLGLSVFNIIPPGATYVATNSGSTLTYWAELR